MSEFLPGDLVVVEGLEGVLGICTFVASDGVDICVRDENGDLFLFQEGRIKPVPTTETVTFTAERADLDAVLDFWTTTARGPRTRAVANAIQEARR